jgi:hypothetical protein
MKTKGEFITELLSNSKLSVNNREKILKLSAKEFEKHYDEQRSIDTKIDDLEERVEKVEQSIIKPFFLPSEEAENEAWKLPNPRHVADFMSLFNQRNGLKYLTHDFDENSDFKVNEFLRSANTVFKEKTAKLNIPTSLWKIVQKFAFDSKQAEWTSISEDYKNFISLKTGWATKELRDWSKQNNLHPLRNKEFEKVINDFKRITRIKDPNLEKLINTTLEGIFEKELKNFEIEKVLLSKADFYTHVGYLKTAFETIFKEVKEQSDTPEKKKISIKYERETSNEGYYLRKILITHHNSYPQKELAMLINEWKEKGSMGKVVKNLSGYCHWSIETIIDESPTRVNILKENDTPNHEVLTFIPHGFTHVLTFYYK